MYLTQIFLTFVLCFMPDISFPSGMPKTCEETAEKTSTFHRFFSKFQMESSTFIQCLQHLYHRFVKKDRFPLVQNGFGNSPVPVFQFLFNRTQEAVLWRFLSDFSWLPITFTSVHADRKKSKQCETILDSPALIGRGIGHEIRSTGYSTSPGFLE